MWGGGRGAGRAHRSWDHQWRISKAEVSFIGVGACVRCWGWGHIDPGVIRGGYPRERSHLLVWGHVLGVGAGGTSILTLTASKLTSCSRGHIE